MAKRKRTKTLLVSSQKGMDILQPVINRILSEFESNLQLDLYTQQTRNIVLHSRQREKNFSEILNTSDLILVDIVNTIPTSFYDIGIARALGKSIVFLVEGNYIDDLPDLIRQSYVVPYRNVNELETNIKEFLEEYLENPKRFTPRNIIDANTSSQIVVDLEKLDVRDFENLCFELLARLGYKHLEWLIKDEFVDAVTTLKKQDPDGFEYDEFWLVSFRNQFVKNELLDMAIHDPQYFAERTFFSLIESNTINSSALRNDVPITLLLILRGKENYSKKIIREMSKREFRMNRRGSPFTMRIRWWDDQLITTLVQNNLPLARKYFSQDAISRSGARLSYEELYNQYAELNEQLQNTNQLLISERNKIESLERDAAWKLLSFTAAHRLGNPMDAIDSELSNLKIALKTNNTKVIDEIIDSMEIPVERAKSIVSEFRNLSVAHEIKPEVVDSIKLHEILKYSAKQALDKNIKVSFDFDDVPTINIDIQKLSDCFGEIVSNSMHFVTGQDQQINIFLSVATKAELPDELDKTISYVKITFLDNGCGIPFDKKLVIFKPFERSYVHGTGLGLAYCDNIIEEHGGKIREVGKINEGAIFEVFLPINKLD